MSISRAICLMFSFVMLAAQTDSGFALSTGNGGGSGTSCKSGERRHCTLGPPPVCSCVPETSIKKINKSPPAAATGGNTIKSMNFGNGGGSSRGRH
jgi:hypothetical protein